TKARPSAAPKRADAPSEGRSHRDSAAASVASVAKAKAMSDVARLACATRLGSRAAALVATAAAPGEIHRRVATWIVPRRRASHSAPGARAAKRSARASLTPAARAALRASTLGNMIGVFELKRSWLARSVIPVSRKRSLHWRW